MKKFVIVLLMSMCGCYAEWDVPKTPRRDPCTKRLENKYVYVYPVCAYPPPQPPPIQPLR